MLTGMALRAIVFRYWYRWLGISYNVNGFTGSRSAVSARLSMVHFDVVYIFSALFLVWMFSVQLPLIWVSCIGFSCLDINRKISYSDASLEAICKAAT